MFASNNVSLKVEHGIYRVTSAGVKKTQSGHEIYNIQLDNSIGVTKSFPVTRHQRTYDRLHIKYKEHNNSLDFLLGKIIRIGVSESKYGKVFSDISSFDILADFKDLLDKANGKAFAANLHICEFLTRRGYPVNPDMSVTLREPYAMYNVKDEANGHTICYPKEAMPGTLTLENIKLIYENFFKGRYIDTHNPDRAEEYGLRSVAIVIYGEKFHKSLSKTIGSYVHTVMQIGDRLTVEQQEFLLSHER